MGSKVIGGLIRAFAGPGSSGNPPGRVPWASTAWFLASNPQIQKNVLALLIVKKLPLAFLVVKKLPSALLGCQKMPLAFLVDKKCNAKFQKLNPKIAKPISIQNLPKCSKVKSRNDPIFLSSLEFQKQLHVTHVPSSP